MKQLSKQSNNKYLEKVRGELDAFQRHLLDGAELTPTQWETWHQIDGARAWLKDGFTDSQVLAMVKNANSIQERRAREIMALAYAVFAELRQSRDKDGVKDLYAEQFRAAAKLAKEAGDYYNFGLLMKEAAKIDGAYESSNVSNADQYKKPSKVSFKVKTLVINNAAEPPKTVENTTYELG